MRDMRANGKSTLNVPYLKPLVASLCGDPIAESIVSRITLGEMDVAALATYVEEGAGAGAFSLGIDRSLMRGKRISGNYTSAEMAREEVTKSVAKRVTRGHTLGPYRVEDLRAMGIPDLACNSIGAVSKKNTTDMRPVDDMHANDAISPPKFGMPSIDILREDATPGCFWWTVDAEDAFANVDLGAADRPFMLFRWYHIDDTNFEGSSHDYVYLHVRGNFGPRTLPYIYTMIQLYVNVASMAVGVTPPPTGFIDDNTATRKTYDDSYESLQLYKQHLRMAGLPDKESKEMPPFQVGIILGRWFDSLRMTMSITPDKLRHLETMFVHVVSPRAKVSVKFLESFVGFWEFCLECLPQCLKSFAHDTHAFMSKVQALRASKLREFYVPRKVKKDVSLMLQVTPLCNGTQPLQPMRGKEWARVVMTDASKLGGGYCSPDFAYRRKFTCREVKGIIAVKEAAMVEEAFSHHCQDWEGMVVPVYVDNTAVLYAMRKGRSSNAKINAIVRRTLMCCAQHEIAPLFFYVPTHMNVLADMLSRFGKVDIGEAYAQALTHFVWPDEAKATGVRPKKVNFSLPSAIEDDIVGYADAAYEDGSIATWSSGWNSFLQYCEEAKVDPLGEYSPETWDHIEAGFKARLAKGFYGRGKEKQTNTILSYTTAVHRFREKFFKKDLSGKVMRGIKKEKGLFSRVKRTVTLDMAVELTLGAVKSGSLRRLRNAVIYAHLGQGICRAQAAVMQTICWWEMDRALTVADVIIDDERYAVGFGLKHSKNDQFHQNASLDDAKHRDWIWISGTPESPLDIVGLIKKYYVRMKFETLTPFQRERTAFYQQVDNVTDRPLTRPLTYKNLLAEYRRDLSLLNKDKYPCLEPSEWGLHSWRRFGATVAKRSGMPNDIIRRLGRWRSDAFELYFALTSDDEISLQAQMLQGTRARTPLVEGGGLPASDAPMVIGQPLDGLAPLLETSPGLLPVLGKEGTHGGPRVAREHVARHANDKVGKRETQVPSYVVGTRTHRVAGFDIPTIVHGRPPSKEAFKPPPGRHGGH